MFILLRGFVKLLVIGFVAAFLAWPRLHVHAQSAAQPATATAAQAQTPAQPSATKAADRDDDDVFDHIHKPGDAIVPIATFLFVLILILGVRYMRERRVQAQIELMKLMVEKGQQIPESAFQELHSHRGRWRGMRGGPEDWEHRQSRRGFGMTLMGLGFGAYAYLHSGPEGLWIASIVLLSIGVSSLVSKAMSKKP